ncbi:MAG: hypothetical protein IT450_05410 [Phycisphaerales bacterium]|nr:hypothetical protein [Phycisphaerales bacterium]
MHEPLRTPLQRGLFIAALLVGTLLINVPAASGRQTYRRNFFTAYPQAVGTRLDVLNGSQHCGVCHYNFNGGGARNPYGLAVEATPNRSSSEILALGGIDSDGDGFASVIEILDPQGLYANIPTFPGLTAGNVGQATNVNLALITNYLTPEAGADVTPPTVTVTFPTAGVQLGSSLPQTIQWTATDNSGTVAIVHVYASYDGGVVYDPIGLGLENTGELVWFVPNRPTTQARIRVEALDPTGNVGTGLSPFFTITSTAVGRVPTTLRDFDLPGTQPLGAAPLNKPSDCRFCHGDYDEAVEPAFNWRGNLMAHASIDPIFLAALEIANHDAPESGDLCLRCHMNRGWLAGRSTPTDGSQLHSADLIGVSCDLCHRMVDPIYEPGVSPPEDQAILAALHDVPTTFGSGQFVIDPDAGVRRGPFNDPVAPHATLYSPFHREAALCGTCHDVSNPVFERQPDGSYLPGPLNAKATMFGAHQIGPVERTYSEWFYSAYNTPQGVYNPVMGGNREYVASCQDCHMRAVTGAGCYLPEAPIRNDLPLHDMTGGSVWLPTVLGLLEPNIDTYALSVGAERARFMLQNAARLDLEVDGANLEVKVTNLTGHKLPTGYPEGRRMWLQVRFYDSVGALVGESGRWDADTGDLTHDAALKVYESIPVIGENIAAVVGLPAGTEFHFALNNAIAKDNRIPPLGFSNAAYAAVGAAPVGATYADGQNWDETVYAIPEAAVRAEVALVYQSISKEFVEFLRDNGSTGGPGQMLYDLWDANGKCPPEEMAAAAVEVNQCPADLDGNGSVDLTDLAMLLSHYGTPSGAGHGDGDLDGDGDVDLTDLSTLLSQFGTAC